MRLDIAVAQRLGLPRNRAQFLIESGRIAVFGKTVSKVSTIVEDVSIIEVIGNEKIYVSRSAHKLLDFLETEHISIEGKTCLDIGSSTGGWTQVLLEKGAQKVVAVDVGTAQMHPSIATDQRVELHEKTDIRSFQTPQAFDIIVVDASFISLVDLTPTIVRLAPQGSYIIALFKPQFEVGSKNLRKTGVPKRDVDVRQAYDRVSGAFRAQGFRTISSRESTLAGEAGNREKLFLLEKVG